MAVLQSSLEEKEAILLEKVKEATKLHKDLTTLSSEKQKEAIKAE